jgi:hypothetical protein
MLSTATRLYGDGESSQTAMNKLVGSAQTPTQKRRIQDYDCQWKVRLKSEKASFKI